MPIVPLESPFILNGTTFRKPSRFGIERYKLTKSGRLASGSAVFDIIAKKRKFTLQWDIISGEEMQAINAIVDGDDSFMVITYVENGVSADCTVYPGAIKYDEFRTAGGWYYRGYSFDLIEK